MPLDLKVSDCRHGRFLYNPVDTYIGRSLDLYGEFSEGEAELFAQLIQPGDAVVEVGANLGALTVPLARIAGLVVAFEPQRIIHQQLCANVALNGLTNVFAKQMALGSEIGSIITPNIDYSVPANFGGVPLGEWETGETVQAVTLDGLAAPKLDFLKIDVEGMECAVIRGARETLARCRPLIYVENDREEQSAELVSLLRESGYRLWWHCPPLYSPSNFRGNAENVFGNLGSINILGVPVEADAEIAGLVPVE